MSDSIKRLQQLFSRFPTIGSRTAGRFVNYLVNLSKPEVDELISAIAALKQNVKLCSFCFKAFENSAGAECEICSDKTRNQQLLCIIEKEADLISIENTKKFKGRYFILSINPRLEALKSRTMSNNFTEIIVALNPTPEGKSTSVLVERVLREASSSKLPAPSFKITHLAQGIPVGGELEYADEETLESAFEGRK